MDDKCSGLVFHKKNSITINFFLHLRKIVSAVFQFHLQTISRTNNQDSNQQFPLYSYIFINFFLLLFEMNKKKSKEGEKVERCGTAASAVKMQTFNEKF